MKNMLKELNYSINGGIILEINKGLQEAAWLSQEP